MQEHRERRKQQLRLLVCPGKKTESTNLQMPFSDIGIAWVGSFATFFRSQGALVIAESGPLNLFLWHPLQASNDFCFIKNLKPYNGTTWPYENHVNTFLVKVVLSMRWDLEKGDVREHRERRKQKLRFLVCPGKKTGSTNLPMPFSDIGTAWVGSLDVKRYART